MDYQVHPIGVIRTPFTALDHTPIQASRSTAMGRVEVFTEFAEGLQDIEELSHLILLYVLHQHTAYTLRVQPFLDDRLHGVFATRYPQRPNFIGLSIVRLISREDTVLHFEGADMLDGTPLIDIKPYVPEFDHRSDVHIGWYGSRSKI
ncbi:MAG: tRNA (N6-threonylcarbamoyladenosine(37)-N6)-methyltransferase TrmO [Thermoflexales bacterium]|nr:tRNA (N6-threonylcarbamoyladenosine(37)-N6)-methyltransferase TrmO [Thermoflexales bacterium]